MLIELTYGVRGMSPLFGRRRYMPDVDFVLAGAWKDDAIEYLRSFASPNVTFTGWLSDQDC
jgi:hypothetical protein